MNKKSTDYQRGMTVQVLPFEYEQHLIGGAVVNPPKQRDSLCILAPKHPARGVYREPARY